MLRSSFFAYLGRLKWIKRWGLMRNVEEENVMEHSWQVATIAHTLAVIHNQEFGGNINVDRVATTALYHDVSEIITGDLPTPIKYHSEKIKTAYKAIEHEAEAELLALLPENLRASFSHLLLHDQVDSQVARFVKAADLISAYQKCQTEMQAGNQEFKTALADLEQRLRQLRMQEVEHFMSVFNDSYLLTLDELLSEHESALMKG
ncbi:MAG: 5'-deoxynucleotidase [Pseudomonadales bacterium]|nr:5'-deoxynucleotidase [Pseudomonadales bacterium]